MKHVIFVALLVAFTLATSARAFSQEKKSDTVSIKTSAVCGMCKERLESGLAFEKGVKDVALNDETKVLVVIYNPRSTTADAIRKKVTKLGYDADALPADPKAYEKLPACCKKEVAPH